HRQSEACPMILRREIEVKDLREVLSWDADAGVLEPNLDAVARRRGVRQPQRAAVRHRLARIDGQVEKGLPQHRRIAVDPRRGRGSIDLDANAVRSRLRLD